MTLRRTLAYAASVAVAAVALAAMSAQVLAAPSTWLELDGNIRTDAPPGPIHDWGNSGAASPTNTCPVVPGVVNVSGTGGLFNCGSPGAGFGGFAPPNPPTLTPSAAADASIVSAVFIVDPIKTDSTACGAGDPTIFGGGFKNGDDLNTFTSTTGSVDPKNDLSNVYAVSRIRPDGHHELFFGAERLDSNGDSHMDFEFLQSKVTVSAACSGTFAGHRTQGDLLLAVDFTVGGGLPSDNLFQWHCNAEPGPQPAVGTVCDPSGATPVPHYQQLTTLLPGTLTFLVNSATIDCGGWVCRTQIVANDFMEGGIDLQVLPFNGCFNSFLPHTRTAQSFTSDLKDFAGPSAFHTCRAIAPPGLPDTGLVDPDWAYGRPHPFDPPSPAAPPVRLSVPALGINAPVETVRLDRQGNLASPAALKDVAWYAGGAAPGDPGSAVMDGHLGVRPGQAVFWNLPKIRAGDVIVVTQADGTQVQFKVDSVQTYSRTATVPQIFSTDGPPQLWLITCSGRWDYSRATYKDRLVVHAVLADSGLGPRKR